MPSQNKSICPECQGKLTRKEITHDVRFHGQLHTFYEVPARVCDSCGAVYLDAAVLKSMEMAFKKHYQPQEYQKVPVFSYSQLAV